jgi:hypothetical protein
MAERILTLRELNRATLARQLLLERVAITPLDALKHLDGVYKARCPTLPILACGHACTRSNAKS